MPHQTLEYPNKPFSTVKRYNTRANYELETIHGIINTSPILHVSFNAPNSPFPVILPMLGQMGSFDRPSADLGDVLDLYLHGYVSSRLINLGRNPSAAGEDNGNDAASKRLPLSVAASHLDGLVLALTPNNHSYNYRSAVLFGHASLVTDADEKLWAMKLITNAVVPDRWRNSRVPPNAGEMASTSILRVRIESGSAKIRSGPPHDDKGDLEDEALLDRTWTGVVPVYQALGEPLPSSYNRVASPPGYLADFVKDGNADAKELAETAAVTEVEPKKVRE